MTYIYRLAGENLELAKAEIQGFLKSQNIDEKIVRKGRLAETQKHPDRLKRLALTHEITKKITEIETDNLKEFEPEDKPEKSFCINCKVLEGKNETPKIEEILGKKFSSGHNSVDLEQPDTEIYAYVQKEKIVIGELIQKINRGLFNQRSNEKRPFSSPVSLDPVLARVLVNLSGTPASGKVLDPFCGTGGILIEAGLCGIIPLGTDTKKEMVRGTRKNLEKYGLINHKIKQIDAENSLENFEEVNSIITDLPYGKASNVEGNPEEIFLNMLEKFEGKTVFMYDKSSVGGFEADFSIYIHKNMSRYIYSI